MTYSLESAFVRAYAATAVAVQGLLDKFATFERITRPPRQQWADLDTPLDGADQLAEREAEEEVSEPRSRVAHVQSDGTPIWTFEPSTLDDVVAQLCQLTYFVEDMRNLISAATIETSAADSPAGVEHPPVPPAGIPLATWLEPAVLTVLDGHRPLEEDDGIVYCRHDSDAGYIVGAAIGAYCDQYAWMIGMPGGRAMA